MTHRIVIKGGVAAGFADEMRLPLADRVTERVSVIVPQNPVLHCAFAVLRAFAAEDGPLAAWTRCWRCLWMVRIDGQAHGPFGDRAEAIRFEKALIQRLEKLEAFLHVEKDARALVDGERK